MKRQNEKIVYCLKCKRPLHPSDWEILKNHNSLPVCDDCEMPSAIPQKFHLRRVK
jgi:NAD-dependent SIR2 family protein deacetylase